MIQVSEQTVEERMEELERRVAELEEWLEAVAQDMLDRTEAES